MDGLHNLILSGKVLYLVSSPLTCGVSILSMSILGYLRHAGLDSVQSKYVRSHDR